MVCTSELMQTTKEQFTLRRLVLRAVHQLVGLAGARSRRKGLALHDGALDASPGTTGANDPVLPGSRSGGA